MDAQRLYLFLATLAFFTLLERVFEFRTRVVPASKRIAPNLLLILSATLISKFVVPISLLAFASYCQKNGLGILNYFSMPFLGKLIISIVLLDMVIYWQHRVFHKLPLLWSVHKVHHSDLDLDATSALRFHPIEILISISVKMIAIMILGVPASAIVVFEVILSSMAIFNHSNLYIPKPIENTLRILFVTPQMHIVHHSLEREVSNTNFGFNLSVWDRLFNSYKDNFNQNTEIGIDENSKRINYGFIDLLKMPFNRN